LGFTGTFGSYLHVVSDFGFLKTYTRAENTSEIQRLYNFHEKAFGSCDTSLTRNPERIGCFNRRALQGNSAGLREDLPYYRVERETHPPCGSSSVCLLYVNSGLRFSFGQFRA
jgi:hypothetical protein